VEDICIADIYISFEDEGSCFLRLRWSLSNFWLRGGLLSDRDLIRIHDWERGCARSELVLVNGHSTTYSLERGSVKAAQRSDIVESLRSRRERDSDVYARSIDEARSRAAALTPRGALDFLQRPAA
jgi:hypothetical protein